MKVATGFLYMVVSLLGLFWYLQLSLLGMYGVPASRWYAVIAVGSIILFLGSLFRWFSQSDWSRWVQLLGNFLLVAYFVPALIVTLYRCFVGQAPVGAELAIRIGVALLFVISFWLSLRDVVLTLRTT